MHVPNIPNCFQYSVPHVYTDAVVGFDLISNLSILNFENGVKIFPIEGSDCFCITGKRIFPELSNKVINELLTLMMFPKNNPVKGFPGSIVTPTQVQRSSLTLADTLIEIIRFNIQVIWLYTHECMYEGVMSGPSYHSVPLTLPGGSCVLTRDANSG